MFSGNVAGSFTIALPDGRLQTTRYTATNDAGFVADVTFEGTPVYPAEKAYAPAPYAPAPAPYKAPYKAPAYPEEPPKARYSSCKVCTIVHCMYRYTLHSTLKYYQIREESRSWCL